MVYCVRSTPVTQFKLLTMAKKQRNFNAILAIVVGVVILVWPNVLALAVAIFLIVHGLMELFDK